jgi:hypothetical protein
MPMKNKTTVLLTICLAISIQSVYAATIPAGTTLFVQTNDTIASTDPVGKKFAGQLYRDVVASGKVLLRTGTGVVGRVKKSRGLGSKPLILDLTQLSIGQRVVPITTEGFRADYTYVTTRRGVSVGGGYFKLRVGTRMQFRLSKPIDLGVAR